MIPINFRFRNIAQENDESCARSVISIKYSKVVIYRSFSIRLCINSELFLVKYQLVLLVKTIYFLSSIRNRTLITRLKISWRYEIQAILLILA